jgi:hypothetical protein
MDVCTHSHIPCHCEAYSKYALYNHSLSICFFLYKNLSSWFKGYKLAVRYDLTQDASEASHRRDPVELHIVTDVHIHNPENTNN